METLNAYSEELVKKMVSETHPVLAMVHIAQVNRQKCGAFLSALSRQLAWCNNIDYFAWRSTFSLMLRLV